MSPNQILVSVIGVFLFVTGVMYLFQIKGNQDAGQREKTVSYSLLIVGLIIAFWPIALGFFDGPVSDPVERERSNLLGADAYQAPVKRDENSYKEASDLYLKSIANWNPAIAGFDSIELVSERLNKSIELFETAEAYTARGQLKLQLSKLESAIEDYNRALEINSKFANAYFNRATVYYIMGDLERACADWRISNELGAVNSEETLMQLCN